MGLTGEAKGKSAMDGGLSVKKRAQSDKVVALAGNPNVGKSTVFNALTGMRQHTGNWPGKTVVNAQGFCRSKTHSLLLVDIPGAYSLLAHSAEEEVARNFICFGEPDAIVVVCDATCIERNLNLVLQTLEITSRVVVCVNLMDEAKRKQIHVDLATISKRLGVPVVGAVAQKKDGLRQLLDTLDSVIDSPDEQSAHSDARIIRYPTVLEKAVAFVEPVLERLLNGRLSARWLGLRLLDRDASLVSELEAFLGPEFFNDDTLLTALNKAEHFLEEHGVTPDMQKDMIVTALVHAASEVCKDCVTASNAGYDARDRKLDRLLTSRLTGYPIMIALLLFVFYLTLTGANLPSQWLSNALFFVQDRLLDLAIMFGVPVWLREMLVLGMYRVLAWVVSVMLPPMAVFFPLFTLLEDAGYLPRIAYNLDKPFQRCRACGKQALTMCMGFGCNAAGVVGCRIIDSPRERLLAILTNSFVPCNGRFPTLIAIITMFFIGTAGGALSSTLSAVLLTGVIVLGVAATFAVTGVLSRTLLRGAPSSFTLELPPYRKPLVGRVIVRSMLDRTLYVLGRAAAVAAPAGIFIWIMANITVADASLLQHAAMFLDPFAHLFGLDGVILIAFILGFPANEIVIPIIIMAYMAQGSLVSLTSLSQMKQLFVANGWTWVTALCTMLFSLMHWPCSTTLLTVRKETGSWKWTALAAALPTGVGMLLCFLVANIARLFA